MSPFNARDQRLFHGLDTRLVVRLVPWLLALIGLVIPLVGSGFLLAPLVAVWLIILAFIWIAGRHAIPRHRGPRVVLAIGVLPLLLAAAWEGGWWLIPADLAWLLIELVGRDRRRGSLSIRTQPPDPIVPPRPGDIGER